MFAVISANAFPGALETVKYYLFPRIFFNTVRYANNVKRPYAYNTWVRKYIYYVHEENTRTISYACMYEVYWWIGIVGNARRAVQIELCRIIEKRSYSSRAVFFHPRNSKNGTPIRKKSISFVALCVYAIYVQYLIYRRRDVFRKTNSNRFFDEVNNNKIILLMQMRTII